MAGTAAAVGAAKGFRGVAQDFLAPELRALTERIQGFEHLNHERFGNVDRQIVNLKETMELRFKEVDHRFAETDRKIDGLKETMDQRFAEVDRKFEHFKENIDLRFKEVDHRLDRIESRLDSLDARLAALPGEFAKSIDRLIGAMDISNRLAVIERDKVSHLNG